jgi:N-methylhydantoinase A
MLRQAFETEHEVQYGYRSPQESLQFTSLRVVARALREANTVWRAPTICSGHRPAESPAPRRVFFGPDIGWAETPVLGRNDIGVEYQPGPLAIEEYDSTTIVPPRCRVRRDEWGNILMELS